MVCYFDLFLVLNWGFTVWTLVSFRLEKLNFIISLQYVGFYALKVQVCCFLLTFLLVFSSVISFFTILFLESSTEFFQKLVSYIWFQKLLFFTDYSFVIAIYWFYWYIFSWDIISKFKKVSTIPCLSVFYSSLFVGWLDLVILFHWCISQMSGDILLSIQIYFY